MTTQVARRSASTDSVGTMVAARKRAPIIDRPSAAALPARIGWQLLWALLSSAWLICWGPLLTLGVWGCGLLRLQATVEQADGLHYLQQMMLHGCTLIALQTIGLLAWAGKDYWRFARKQRRQQSPPVSVGELARYAQLPGAALGQWQRARCMVAEHDDGGQLFSARSQRLPNAAVVAALGLHARDRKLIEG